jgi:small subunit ribosomal protein S19e
MVRVAKVSTGVATTVRDVSPESFIAAYAKHLKDQGQMQVPTWVDIVKTGSAKELAPYDEDWYFIRAASIARKVYLNKGVGCGQLQRWYGGSFRKRCQRSHFRKASGQIIRTILKDLTRMGLVETIVDASSENKEAPVTW